MYGELLMGTLVALAAPQEPQETREEVYEIRIPAIEIEIPEIEIPEYVVVLRTSGPGVEFQYQGTEFFLPYMDISIPSFTIEIPQGEYAYGHAAAHERSFQDVEMDTTFAVERGARLELRNHAGEIVVRHWDRDQIRLEAVYSSDDRIKVFHTPTAVRVKSEARYGHPDAVDYELTIPAWMEVDLWGFYTDILVDGIQNNVRVETLEGDIEVRNVRGESSLQSVEGDVSLQRSSGRFQIHSTDGEVTVIGFEGEAYAESIDGDIRLEDIRSASVEAKTVDGDVFYEGTIADNGRYKLSTHDGDVMISLRGNVNATVSVATFEGEFEADFPVQLEPGTQASRKFSFVIGNGSARLELHTFDGDIQLLRR
ncbi:MAG: DUF4097 domain-containing protein [Gemmatimonadetes bacterium]|uniref:DUF4097 domain-containing protein n=1 Tax=Candidatus Kutchimonas denitrificans TaxID=3056748 RepID=A0AAE4Z5Y9_9BACT|nr:DUF4097 domain-containing protein [Gemmatimonadota bacterium]NIR73969.1 DUF4097 domain-containing protein [Candidatus Kutchimonas denitrificans]NIS02958.1 DUF4097 domain-containing protein [Gemmatimonadota bacterium]NIT68675.1 DUF4097 domain-containing protein [Gemmatimonadota bacterium]NIU53256.1 DUF4097 family beta strand repeat protein [Gemmatimonadota bacterium]